MSLILVVEDDPELQELLTAQLEGSGHEVRVAGDGRQALELARTVRPAATLVDLNLPGMNGFELLRSLRKEPATRGVPCVIMTALQDPGGLLETAAGGLGAVDFIQKPFKVEDLQDVLRDALSGRPAQEPYAGQSEKGLVKLDAKFRRVWVRGKPMGILPRKRFHLLWLLAGREGPVTKEEILDSIWAGAKEADINRLEKTVQRLREDLGRDGPRLIRTLPGGYELKA